MARTKKTGQTEKANKAMIPKDKLLSRLSVSFFDRPLITAFLWIALTLFGALSYTTLLRREGFPSVNFPLAFVGGTYFANDPTKVDELVAEPITRIALEQDGVSSVQTRSGANFFSVQISYEEGVDAKSATTVLEQAVKEAGVLPQEAMTQYSVPYFGATGGSEEKIDIALSFYADDAELGTAELATAAEAFATKLRDQRLHDVEDVFVIDPFEQTTNPATGEQVTVQRSFDRYGMREDGTATFRDSVVVGVAAKDGFDVVNLDATVKEAIDSLKGDEVLQGFHAEISASFAPSIKENISELQRSLLEGLIAVLIVGSIVITIRASLITVISMITVVAMTLGLLYAIGYTLNVITLFSLILALALVVDDTIIMVEAIDAARHRYRDKRKAVQEATRKVSRAMVAATLTAGLSFAPLLFVGGLLGNFIRAIPVTVISALLISLLVALIFIPLFARYLLLGKKQMGKKVDKTEVAAGFEAALARFVTRPMVWARHSTKKLFFVGSTAVLIGMGFVVAALLIARDVPFNIFPPTKDSNGLSVTMTFQPGTTTEQAEVIAADVDTVISDTLGDNFEQLSYYGSGSDQGATSQIEIISYSKRKETSHQLVDKVQAALNERITNAMVTVGQVDIGPPASSFVVQVVGEDREAALKAADDLKAFMERTELTRPNGTTVQFKDIAVAGNGQVIRSQGQPVITVSAGFDADDTSTIVALAQQAIRDEYDADKLASFGLPSDAVQFELGFESENQESFATLAIAFPVLLVVMYILLAIQFRSLLQPLLIFMAIPFSLFGIALGLDLTSNVFSFFAMLGFFALLGLSIKNTILLTDYANQAHKAGMGTVDSAVEALKERFRPLFATSVTAIVSLIPLAVTSPFWEGLMVVLIFGLISSTFLVVTVFPYYYLGAEYLRLHIRRSHFLLWLAGTVAVTVLVAWFVNLWWGLLMVPLSIMLVALQGFYSRRLAR